MNIIKYKKLPNGDYESQESLTYYSSRYMRSVYIPKGQVRDGATGAFDIRSNSWWVHDQLCADGVWRDQSKVTPWQAAVVLRDILMNEGRVYRAIYWPIVTYLFGCKKLREK